jgi:hypothetical protein
MSGPKQVNNMNMHLALEQVLASTQVSGNQGAEEINAQQDNDDSESEAVDNPTSIEACVTLARVPCEFIGFLFIMMF